MLGKYGETLVYKGGLKVTTTLNLGMQRAAEAAFDAGIRELDKRQGWRGPLRKVDPASLKSGNYPVETTDQPVAVGDFREAVVTKVGKDFYLVQLGNGPARLSFDDMAWAKKRLKGSDPTKNFVVTSNLKRILKPGEVIEVRVKQSLADIQQWSSNAFILHSSVQGH